MPEKIDRTDGYFEGLGNALRVLRTKRGYTQTELSDRSGLTKAMISEFENEHRRPTVDSLGRLLSTLSADLSELGQAMQESREIHESGSIGSREDHAVKKMLNVLLSKGILSKEDLDLD